MLAYVVGHFLQIAQLPSPASVVATVVGCTGGTATDTRAAVSRTGPRARPP